MHILVAHNEYGQPSGEERALATFESLMVQRGHRVTNYRRRSSELMDVRVGLAKAFFAGIHNPSARREMARLLDAHQPDAVLIQNLYPLLSPAILAPCRRRNIPVVMRCCNYRLFCPSGLHMHEGRLCERCLGPGREAWCVIRTCEGSLGKSAGYALRNAAARLGGRLIDHVDAFIVLTEFQKQRFIRQGIPADRLVVVSNSVEPWADVRAPGDRVTFIGRVAAEKGIAEFLAFARAMPDIPFAVAGAVKAGEEHLLRDVPANVEMMGYLERPALESLLERTRVLVACSTWFEGFPNTILDAMAAGRPVAAFGVGGISEIVSDEVTGLVLDPADMRGACGRLGELYRDVARCAAMGAAARRKVTASYSRGRVYEAYLQAFSLASERLRMSEASLTAPSLSLPLQQSQANL